MDGGPLRAIASIGGTTMQLKSAVSALAISFCLVPPAIAHNGGSAPRVEVAFVLDTTGSMGDLIDGAKRKIWSIANTIVETNPEADIAMALVAYRDRGDDYVVKTEPLSEDLQGIYGRLVRLEADGGNDTPESVNQALAEAVNGLQWSSGDDTKRIIFLVGDAPPHMDYAQERQYPEIVRRAVARGITVNTIQAGDMVETTPVWQEIAQYGHGRYMAIPQSGGQVSVIITPFDDAIIELQRELDGTVVPYGGLKKRTELEGKMRDKAAAPKSVQVENSEYYSKRMARKEVVTGGGDLISDLANKDVEFDKIAPAELPEPLQNLSREEQTRWLAEAAAKRQELETRMRGEIAKRDAFVAEKKAADAGSAPADSFDEAVKETLKLQLN
jgi:hypothetical protein